MEHLRLVEKALTYAKGDLKLAFYNKDKDDLLRRITNIENYVKENQLYDNTVAMEVIALGHDLLSKLN